MFRALPRILPRISGFFPYFLRKNRKPILISSIFSVLISLQIRKPEAKAVRFVSVSQSIGFTIFSRQDGKALASGFFLTKDGVFVTILNVFPGRKLSEINASQQFYLKPWSESSLEVPFELDYVLEDENLAFGHIMKPESPLNISVAGFSQDEKEIGQKVYFFSKSANFSNVVESGLLVEKGMDSMINVDCPETTVFGTAVLDKEGKIVGMMHPPGQEGREEQRYNNLLDGKTLKTICEQYIAKKEVKRAYLGFSVKKSDQGVTVIKVSTGGPGSLAGLRLGDLLMEVNGKRIESVGDLLRIVGYSRDEKLRLKVLRNGSLKDLELLSGSG